MKTAKKSSDGGSTVVVLMGIVFVCLKLLGITAIANWSWWWVTAPFWAGAALFILVFVVVGFVAVVVSAAIGIWDLIDDTKQKPERRDDWR